MKKIYCRLLFLITFLIPLQYSFAQGVTTSSLTGTITDAGGEGLPGATVVAVHTPSGTRYGTTTLVDGRFTIPNMRVGGPYMVTVSFIGFQEQSFNNINLSLGTASTLNASLAQQTGQLNEVQIISNRDDVLSPERTGASTNVSREVIQSLPTISRSIQDFTRLSPLANTSGNGTQFAGTNNRYNQFAIDGIVNNDVFGLSASGTNGGQTGIQPISLDAIEEFQINIAPYDVRQGGFTGGGINAVTRSGTNKFQGSAYFFGNNQSFVGRNNPNTGENARYPEQSDYQTGFRLGGPIVKNKLFFFVNGEITRNIRPYAFDPTINSGSLVTQDEINRVINTIRRVAPNYNLGSFAEQNEETNSNKILGKIDWNIADNHRLTLRHSYTYGENIYGSRDNNDLRFYNNFVYFPSTTNSTALELNSTFGSKFSNNLLAGYTTVRDDREPMGDPFPNVRINNLAGRGSITLGGESSSVANELNQDVFTITDNFSIYKGKHTFTVGTNNEFYSFYNLFVQNIFGNYTYRNLADFETIGTPTEVAPTYFQTGYSFADDGPFQSTGAGEFNAMQLGLYVQDEIQLTDNFRLTAGLRADLPVFPDEPPFNQTFATAFQTQGLSTSQLPETKVLWSPRLGFNWDVLGDNSLKVRGGTGIFTGRVPFVWISNQFSNNGTLNGTYSIGSTSTSATPLTNQGGIPVRFIADPFNQPAATYYGRTAGLGDINITTNNFNFPQTFRSNIGVDKQLPFGLVATIEALYSKGLNNVNFVNLNRQVDPNFTFTGPDQRPRFASARPNTSFNEIILLESSNEGYSYNFVGQLQKQLDHGWGGSIAYTYGKSKDLNSGTSSTAYSNWRYVNAINPNDLEASYANFDLRHRVSGYLTYRKEYLGDNAATQVSLFYSGQSGQPVSYVYDGDLNNDGTDNDLIYIPRNFEESGLVATTGTNPITAQDQWTNLNSFIENDDYLSSRRGQYVERNGARLPFQHLFDVRLLQEFGVKTGQQVHRFQISFDILNVGNLLNNNWGRNYFVSNQTFEAIQFAGLNGTRPTFNYTAANQNNGNIYSISDYNSRWRGQIGLRYIFD